MNGICEICKEKEAVGKVIAVSPLGGDQKEISICEECGGINSSPEEMVKKLSSYIESELSDGTNNEGTKQATDSPHKKKESPKKVSFLDKYGINKTKQAKDGLIDPIIGRDKEVWETVRILNRRNKNNPVLIGEPGVGKTAIAEGLAQLIVEEKVPSKLINSELYLLDINSLIAGTGIKGQLEGRLKSIIQEVKKRDNLILFIDELHMIVGSGASNRDSMDVSNILKPALANGDLQLIGATTLEEYRTIEKDAALERRFQPVHINEPSIEMTIEMIKGNRFIYEKYHHVRIPNETIEAVAKLSDRYIKNRHLPDKAFDLIDEAGADANLRMSNHHNLHHKLKDILSKKDQATLDENYELAASYRDQEKELQKQIQSEIEMFPHIEINIKDIQNLIQQKTGVPVSKLEESEKNKMKNLQENLLKVIVGQDEAVSKVSKAVRRSYAGIQPDNRPIASFLFVGPTGVGKTELAKRLAESVLGESDSILRFDMSEYMEKHSVSKLIGSPPGYVGFEQSGQLTEKVRRNPYSIVLMDEIEKAHPEVQNLFLQALDNGAITDNQGRSVSFEDTIIIMTSNAGSTDPDQKVVGFNEGNHSAYDLERKLKRHFTPEFLNRFDSLVEFNHLSLEDTKSIVDLMFKPLSEKLRDRNITLSITDKAKELLSELGYHKEFGARPLRRTIQEYVEDPLSDMLIDSEEVITQITVGVKNKKIKLTNR